MARLQRFSFLCDLEERHLIAVLAKQLQRSQSDAVRFVIIRMARELQSKPMGDVEEDLFSRVGVVRNRR